jgi:hypothetical protein
LSLMISWMILKEFKFNLWILKRFVSSSFFCFY